MPDAADATTPGTARRSTRRPLVLAGVMMAMFSSAIEATIVATAMPSIVADLGDFSLYSWVFSIFLLTQAVSVPIYGKLADLFGRKPVFTFGIGLFLLGSLLCGLARSMPVLIAFRALQGLGAGAVLPIASTIVGDIYSLEERARVQGYLSSVWGISSVIGPLLGGLFVSYLHWSLVFWVNLPVGLAALWLVRRYLHEEIQRREHSIDYAGAVLLLLSLSALVVALVQGGVVWSWTALPSLGLLGVTAVGLALFVWWERRAAEPLVPALVFTMAVQRTSNIGSLLAFALMMGVTIFIPTYVQGVLGATATLAGFCLTAMSIGWPITSTLVGRLMIRIGYRASALTGVAFLNAGAMVLLALPQGHGALWASAGSFLVGAGMGFTSTVYLVAVQSTVDWQHRGVATGFTMLMRLLGSALGAAALGAVLNNRVLQLVATREGVIQGDPLDAIASLIDAEQRAQLSPAAVEVLREAIRHGLSGVYLCVLGLALVSVLFAALLPGRDRTRG